jgi:translocation and assembly module TamB
MRRPFKIALWGLGGVAGLLLLLGIAALLILPSNWFREKVRTRIVYEVERATGGRVEIGAFRFDWGKLHAEVAPFVLHGTEPAGELPLFRAESVQVELKIISAFKRDIDIASLLVDRPQINLLVDETGVTNFPKPKIDRPKSDKNPVERLIDLKVARIDVRNGELRYGDKRVPLVLNGENMNASLAYNFGGPSYEGKVSLEKLMVDAGPTLPMTVAFASQIGLFKNRIEVNSARMTMPEAQVEAAGIIDGFRNVKVDFDVQANGSLKELGKPLRLPEPHVGNVQFKGKLNYDSIDKLRIAGRVTGQGLAVRQGGVAVNDIAVASDVQLDSDYVKLTGLRVDALDGRFDGMLEIHDFKTYKANGKVTGLSVTRLTGAAGVKGDAFSGFVSGPVELRGSLGRGARDLRAAGKLNVVAGTAGVPIKGFVEVAYDQRRQSLQMGKSFLQLPSSRVDFNGTLGEQLSVQVESTDLNDFTPVIASASGNAPEKLPLVLQPGGTAVFAGMVTGPVRTARIRGDLTIDRFEVRRQKIDRLVANLDATNSGAHVSSFALGQNQLRLAGSADIGLENWKLVDASAIKANLKLEGAQLAKLLADQGRKEPVDGILSGTIEVQGTAADPKAMAKILVDKPEFYGEKFDRIRASIRYAGIGVEVIDGVAELGSARITLDGAYEHPVADFTNGRLRFKAATKGFALERLHNVQTLRPGVEGAFELELAGVIDVKKGEMFPQTLDGDLALRNLIVQGRALGDFTIDAKTTGRELIFGAAGNLRGSKVTGGGTFELAGDYPGSGRIEFTPLSLSTLQDLMAVAKGRGPLPVEGSIEGKITFSGPAKKPELMRARLELPVLQITPARRTFTTTRTEQLSVRNAEPIVAEYDGKQVHVKSAHLVGPETDLRVTGAVGVSEKAAYDLRVDGSLNLGVLQNFDTDLVSSGVATVNASIRGPLSDPNIGGRMQLKNASFSMVDLPNGLDNASGTIVFDQRRATIEKLTAQTGGGDLALSGFVQFGSELTYSLQVRADRVRIRYPEGVSTTANASLNLTGSTRNSLMTGVVTITRAGFNPRTDLAGVLAQAKPTATPTNPSAFLRGMQFDVRIETVPNLQFQTSLTQDLQAEADLRLKGTAAKPVLLGRVVVNQGEIQFFGNKYLINRGEIGFFNPVKIEPVLDMDLETRVRGILVNINFSGTLSKLNVSYRSDPPLQSNEIIALLAMGRAPGSNSSLASSQTVTNQGILNTGTNSLLGQAVAAPVSSRLQRFFGVSRLKIDPQLTGVNAVPQARLTVEQQISRDITMTYITNLAQANSQIVQLQWDINRTWSVIALREENGVFGIDFFYKKRLK